MWPSSSLFTTVTLDKKPSSCLQWKRNNRNAMSVFIVKAYFNPELICIPQQNAAGLIAKCFSLGVCAWRKANTLLRRCPVKSRCTAISSLPFLWNKTAVPLTFLCYLLILAALLCTTLKPLSHWPMLPQSPTRCAPTLSTRDWECRDWCFYLLCAAWQGAYPDHATLLPVMAQH